MPLFISDCQAYVYNIYIVEEKVVAVVFVVVVVVLVVVVVIYIYLCSK